MPWPKGKDRRVALTGSLCAIAALEFIIGVQLAQAAYPQYSATQQYLSDLGATCPGGVGTTPCFAVEPAAMIWGAALTLLGLLSVVGALLLYESFRVRLLPILLGLWGLGTAIAGTFPQSTYLVHGPASGLAFVAGSIAALTTYRSGVGVPKPLGYVSAALGVLSLIGIGILRIIPFAELNASGIGGGTIERLIVYPIVVWELMLGLFLAWRSLRVPSDARTEPARL